MSSESAEEYSQSEQGEGSWSPTDYETLEEYIMSTERDHDMEESKPMRVFQWQKTLMRIIEVEIDTNDTEIGLRAYPMGLSMLRENHGSDIEQIASLLNEFVKVYTNDIKNTEVVDETDESINQQEIEQPYEENASLTDPIRFKIQASYLSEAERNYADHAFMKGWIHRHIMAIGLGKSRHTQKTHENKISSYEAAFSKAIDELRQSIEDEIMSYVQRSEMVWRDVGLAEEVYEGLCDMLDLMNTDNRDDLEYKLGQIEDFVTREGEGDE